MDDFLIRAILIGVALATITGILGCFVVWKKMAYFGDSLAHTSLFGVVIGIYAGIGVNIGIILICLIFIAILLFLQQKYILSSDTILGILAHGGLAFALVALSLLPSVNIDLHSFLFGNVLTVTLNDIYTAYAVCALVVAVLLFNWGKFVLIALHKDLAQSEGMQVFLYDLFFMGMMVLAVGVSIKIVGVLLITSMLIIPAASARFVAQSPSQMALISVFIGIISVVAGIVISSFFDTPPGASIVLALVSIFVFFMLLHSKK